MQPTHVVYEVVFTGRIGRKRNPSTSVVELARHPIGAPEPSNASLKPAVDAALASIQARMARDAQWEVRAAPVRVEVTRYERTGETVESVLRETLCRPTLVMCGIYD